MLANLCFVVSAVSYTTLCVATSWVSTLLCTGRGTLISDTSLLTFIHIPTYERFRRVMFSLAVHRIVHWAVQVFNNACDNVLVRSLLVWKHLQIIVSCFTTVASHTACSLMISFFHDKYPPLLLKLDIILPHLLTQALPIKLSTIQYCYSFNIPIFMIQVSLNHIHKNKQN